MSTSHIEATDFSDNGAVVRVTDHKLHEHESSQLIAEFTAYLNNSGKRLIVMDYTDVEFVSSAGLGAMITISRTVVELEGKMVLTGINDNVLQVMKLTKLDRLLSIEKTLAKAQKKLLK
jgi:anti-sigma B factor antagonist